jgi:cytochrome c oxidase assembly factor CtaG
MMFGTSRMAILTWMTLDGAFWYSDHVERDHVRQRDTAVIKTTCLTLDCALWIRTIFSGHMTGKMTMLSTDMLDTGPKR